ncbi:hypothetical protein J7T55_000051 [Diaporthe amygdali]|uniref:uncharacterized protein n=1 Tax=Phomopsis amygdali TaxID=1214568 RepID=UPI0022FDF7D6|nr:uncharacterized protein J7T55_000051 [Diaporthe amygdali]KAJ0107789.1 hypothetical protein J7T55_000051 [Diaporthe amygdali]
MVLKVAVIGGGPSGLVTLKYLLEARKFFAGANIEAHLFEKAEDVGGIFSYRVYEDAELVSSKYLTTFSDFRVPEHEKDFLTPKRYVEYLKSYATRFALWDHIHLSTKVTSIRPDPTSTSQHVLTTSDAQGQVLVEHKYHAVAICSGLNQDPFIPDIPGLNASLFTSDEKGQNQNPLYKPGVSNYAGIETLHAADFKTRSQFGTDKTILILGVGETAMDIAHLAITSPTERVILCHRDGFHHAPKIIPQPYRAGGRSGGPDPNNPNKPLDCATASLFDTAYVPQVVQHGPWQWAVYDAFVTNMGWMISGTRVGFDQWVGGVSSKRLHTDSLLICKSDRAMPYISEQYRSKSRLNRWRTWLLNMELRPTGGKKIDLAPWPTHVDGEGVVHFERNERPESEKMRREKGIKPDIVIFATGYKQSFPFVPNAEAYPSLDASVTRGIFRDIDDGIAYIGFVRPAFGAIPPLAELQAQHWIYHLITSSKYRTYLSPSFKPPQRSHDAVEQYEMSYKLNCRDKDHDVAVTKRGVDQESYAYQLALDMGSAPTWIHILRTFGREVFFTWALGPNFPTKFRIVGPWANEDTAHEAARLMRADGELGKLVGRTGGAVFFFTYTLIPLIIFAPISIFMNTLNWLLMVLHLTAGNGPNLARSDLHGLLPQGVQHLETSVHMSDYSSVYRDVSAAACAVTPTSHHNGW